MHTITQDSPLYGVTETDLRERDAEFLVLVNAIDDTSSRPVNARSSYKWQEVIWNAQFSDMYRTTKDGHVSVDLRRVHDIEQTQIRRQRQTLWGFLLRSATSRDVVSERRAPNRRPEPFISEVASLAIPVQRDLARLAVR